MQSTNTNNTRKCYAKNAGSTLTTVALEHKEKGERTEEVCILSEGLGLIIKDLSAESFLLRTLCLLPITKVTQLSFHYFWQDDNKDISNYF